MTHSFVSQFLVLGVAALLVVLVVGGPSHASLEMLWHGPDMHNSSPHAGPGSTLLTAAAQPGVSMAGVLRTGSTAATERAGFRVLAPLDATRLDHPPR
jgi:hypothetical protein